MKRKVAVLVILLLLLTAGTALAQYCQVAWRTTLAEFTGSRYRGGGGVYLDKVYIWGGMSAFGTYRNDVQVYDPATNSWSFGANMPAAKSNFGHAIVDGIAYAVAGYYDETVLTSVYAYDILADSWTTVADYPEQLAGVMCADGQDGNLYCFGGNYDTTTPKSTYRYEPATDTWTQMRNMPNWMLYGATATIDGKIYLMGGWQHEGLYIYDVATDTWTTKHGPSDERTGPVMIAAANILWAAGGGYEWAAYDYWDIRWDAADGWYLAGTEMPYSRIYAAGGHIPGQGMYVLGGADYEQYTDTTNFLWQMCAPFIDLSDAVVYQPGDAITISGLDFTTDAVGYLYDDTKRLYPLDDSAALSKYEVAGVVPEDMEEGQYGLSVEAFDARNATRDDSILVRVCDSEEYVVDTGAADGGIVLATEDDVAVQGFALPSDPSRLLAVRYRILLDKERHNPVRLVVYHNSSTKGEPTGQPIYRGDPLALGAAGQWHTLLVHDTALADEIFHGGEVFVGFEATMDGNGPVLATDATATPTGHAWYYGGAWYPMGGGYLLRATVETGCEIDGAFYSAGQADPTNACQYCDPAASLSAWQSREDGVSCDDELYCNGADVCAAGECVHDGTPCEQDGTFCNGEETCDEEEDECYSPGDPCTEEQTCDEENDQCLDPLDDDTIDDDVVDDDDDDDDDDTTPAGDDDDDDDDDGCGC
ncbi:MAG TPA: kelch repeat-containing protein [bacterium]|nr:kelch repeat-containing protein [bacterium]